MERHCGAAWNGSVVILEGEVDDDSMHVFVGAHIAEAHHVRMFASDICRQVEMWAARQDKLSKVLSRLVGPVDKTATVHVGGGNVRSVSGLPDGWLYQKDDRDICPACGTLDEECQDCHGK